MENHIYENLYNQNILPKYGLNRDLSYDNFLVNQIFYPHQYSVTNRVSMLDIKVITIDPPGCKDADDAFSVFYKEDKQTYDTMMKAQIDKAKSVQKINIQSLIEGPNSWEVK